MAKQDYIIKKHVKASTVAEALALDIYTPAHEIFLVADKPDAAKADAIGYKYVDYEE